MKDYINFWNFHWFKCQQIYICFSPKRMREMFKPSMAELGLCMYQVGIDNLTTAVTIFFSIAFIVVIIAFIIAIITFIIVRITIVTFISRSIQSILSSIASPRPTINTLVQEHPLTAKGTPHKTPKSHLKQEIFTNILPVLILKSACIFKTCK